MRTLTGTLLGVTLLAALALAQPPGGGPGGKGDRGSRTPQTAEAFVAKLMAFDKNGDGKLTKEELGDERLNSLFDRADTNKDGFVTQEELTAFYTKESATLGGNRGGGMGKGGPPGGGMRRGDGPPKPGQLLPSGLADALDLTTDQRQQIAALQKEVDAELKKILTPEQQKKLTETGPPARP